MHKSMAKNLFVPHYKPLCAELSAFLPNDMENDKK